MAPRPPSLRAVAAFEAAARHQSFTRAAEELNLTHGAISHAVRALEQRLDVELFERVGRRVVLSAAGRIFAERVRASLAVLSDALEIEPVQHRNRLVVASSPAFAERALCPRLSSFRRAHPNIHLDLRCRIETPTATARGDVDVTIHYGGGSDRGVAGVLLAHESVLPVAAPGCAPGVLTLRDLAASPLLEHAEAPWRDWIVRVAARPPALIPRIVSDDWGVLIEAARSGLGVLLARSLLVEAELESGRLVASPIGRTGASRAYYCSWDAGSPKASLIETFAAWLQAEMSSSRVPGQTAAPTGRSQVL